MKRCHQAVDVITYYRILPKNIYSEYHGIVYLFPFLVSLLLLATNTTCDMYIYILYICFCTWPWFVYASIYTFISGYFRIIYNNDDTKKMCIFITHTPPMKHVRCGTVDAVHSKSGYKHGFISIFPFMHEKRRNDSLDYFVTKVLMGIVINNSLIHLPFSITFFSSRQFTADALHWHVMYVLCLLRFDSTTVLVLPWVAPISSYRSYFAILVCAFDYARTCTVSGVLRHVACG